MLFLLMLFLLLLSHLKIALLQRSLYRLSLKCEASSEYTLESKRAQNLNPNCLTIFHGLSQSQKLEVFASVSSISDLLTETNYNSEMGLFELFWRACHSTVAVQSAKHFQDAMLLMTANKQELVHFILKTVASKSKKSVETAEDNVEAKVESEASLETKDKALDVASEVGAGVKPEDSLDDAPVSHVVTEQSSEQAPLETDSNFKSLQENQTEILTAVVPKKLKKTKAPKNKHVE